MLGIVNKVFIADIYLHFEPSRDRTYQKIKMRTLNLFFQPLNAIAFIY